MTYLGYTNPLLRIGRTIQGWLKPPQPGQHRPDNMAIIGHRGAPLMAPENTIAAFSQAIELGANAIETDVCVTQDACFVLWHDADPDDVVALARQSGAEGLLYTPNVPAVGSPWRQPICQLPYAILQQHYGYSRRTSLLEEVLRGETPPEVAVARFDDLLDWCRGETRLQHIFFDLKFPPTHATAAVAFLEHLRTLYRDAQVREDLALHLLSPHMEIVEALIAETQRTVFPEALKLYGDFELPGVHHFARQLQMRNISMGCNTRLWGDFRLEVSQVIAARDAGLFDSVIAWTVNEESQLQDMLGLGVNGVITDHPALLRRLVMHHEGLHA